MDHNALSDMIKAEDVATDAFANSQFIADAFGTEIRDHYTNFGIQSVKAATPIVSDYERRILLMDI